MEPSSISMCAKERFWTAPDFRTESKPRSGSLARINLVRKTVNSSFENRQGQEGAKWPFSDWIPSYLQFLIFPPSLFWDSSTATHLLPRSVDDFANSSQIRVVLADLTDVWRGPNSGWFFFPPHPSAQLHPFPPPPPTLCEQNLKRRWGVSLYKSCWVG